jgi:hypothetical protein
MKGEKIQLNPHVKIHLDLLMECAECTNETSSAVPYCIHSNTPRLNYPVPHIPQLIHIQILKTGFLTTSPRFGPNTSFCKGEHSR